jgi:hypothetical protein
VVPTVWLLEVDAPALVLGSTQNADIVDADRLAAAGTALARDAAAGERCCSNRAARSGSTC